MIISSAKAYYTVAWALKTPFVFLMDRRYALLPALEAYDTYVKQLAHLQYIANFFDCNAFAWVMKALAYQDHINSFGFIIGWVKWAKQPHAWNCILTQTGVFQAEPQQGRMFEKDKNYRPWLVIF